MDRVPSILLNVLIALGVVTWTTFALADPIGTVDFIAGHVALTHLGIRQPLQEGTKIDEGDGIVTESDGEVHLDMVDGAALSVRPGSSITLSKYGLSENDSILISLTKGALRSVTGWLGHLRPSRYSVLTPTATIGIRGTDHETTYEPDGDSAGTYERVFEGSTYLQDQSGNKLDAKPGAAIAWNREKGQFHNIDERQLPPFILKRAQHDDRFEKRLKQNVEQRMHERLSQHLSELNKRDPTAAKRLRQQIHEKFPNARGVKAPFGKTTEDHAGNLKSDDTRHEMGQRQAENRQAGIGKNQQIAQRAQHRQDRLQHLEEQKQKHLNAADQTKRRWRRKLPD